MNKYAEVFAKQNPEWTQPCMKCKHKNKFKTMDVLKSKKDFTFVCTKCGAENILENIPSFIKDIERKLKKEGIQVK